MALLIIVGSILFLLSLLFSRRKWYAPTVLLTGFWLVSLVCYAIIDRGAHLLHPSTVVAVLCWLVCFCLAAWSVQSVYIKPIFHQLSSSTPARDIYYYFTLCTMPILLIWVLTVVANSGGNPFSALRDANVSGVGGIRTATFFVLVWIVSYIMELQVLSRQNIGRVILLFLANLLYAFISMGKMNFMILFLSTAIILTHNNIVRLRHLVVGACVLLVFFVGLQKMRGSYVDSEHFTALYLTSSLANFDQNVQPNSASLPGENSFRIYYAVRAGLDGGKTPVVDPILPFEKVQIHHQTYHTNTYTALYPFYKDFGLAGVVGFALFLGLLFGYLFKSAEDGSLFALLIYAILAGTIVMQFIGDTFFTVLSQNIQYLIAALVPFVISRYRLFERGKNG